MKNTCLSLLGSQTKSPDWGVSNRHLSTQSPGGWKSEVVEPAWPGSAAGAWPPRHAQAPSDVLAENRSGVLCCRH